MSDDPPDGMTRGDGANDTWALRSSPVATHPHWLLFEDASPFIHCLMGALLLAVGTAGVLGNALVLIVFTRFRRLRGPFSAFIVNLAVADLITSLLHGMVAASCFQGYWMFGTYGCVLYAFCVGYFGLLSIVTLAAIAVERYLVITAKPMSASWKLSQYGARKVIVGAWLYCLCLCLPPLFGWSAYIPEGFLTSCSWDYLSRTPTNRAFYIYLLTLGFALPVTIIAYCYVFILAAVVAHSREMRSVKHTGGSALYALGAAPPVSATTPRSMVRTAEIIIMLVALFLVSWTPYAVVTLIGQFGDESLVTPWVATLPAIFAKARIPAARPLFQASVVYNPIVYGLSHPHFRASLKQYMSSCRGGASSANTVSLAALRDAASTPCPVGAAMRRAAATAAAADLPEDVAVDAAVLRRTPSVPVVGRVASLRGHRAPRAYIAHGEAMVRPPLQRRAPPPTAPGQGNQLQDSASPVACEVRALSFVCLCFEVRALSFVLFDFT